MLALSAPPSALSQQQDSPPASEQEEAEVVEAAGAADKATRSTDLSAPHATPVAAEEVKGYQWSFPAMGTRVTFTAFDEDPRQVEAAFRQAEQLVHDLARVLTDYDPQSETRRLSQEALHRWCPVSAPLLDVLTRADRWYRNSEGAFDASIGAVTHLWRKYRQAGRVPDAKDIERAMELAGWQHVKLDRKSGTVRLDQPIRFDFGAIGKGYIVDRAFERLVASGITRVLVDVSGNMRCGDPPPGREGWRIELAPLDPNGQSLGRIVVANCSIATSGDLWQGQWIDGVRRSHIIDPRTGWGVVGPRSATAITVRAVDADALATIGCILPPEQALRIAQSTGATLLTARRDAQGEVVMRASEEFPAIDPSWNEAPTNEAR